MKILYCIAGVGCHGVLENDVLKRDGLIISAKRVFSLEANPSQVITKGQGMSFRISTYDNVMMNCSFIAEMAEQAPFYQEIIKIVEKEASREN